MGYREEANIPKDSNTETFVALKLHKQLPLGGNAILYQDGKRLGTYGAEIVIQFKDLPNILISATDTFRSRIFW